MKNGDERVRVMLAHLMPSHPDSQVALEFLIEQLRASGREPKISFARALARLGGQAAVTALREFHTSKMAELNQATRPQNRDLILDCLDSCGGLIRLQDSENHLDHIQPFLNHADEIVRAQAAIALQGGPLD